MFLRNPLAGPGKQFSMRVSDPKTPGQSFLWHGKDLRIEGGWAALEGGGGGPIEDHELIRQLIHLADGPWEGFDGAFFEQLPAGIQPTSAIWWTSPAKTDKIVEQTVTYNANLTIATSEWKVYDEDGSTVVATVTDTYTYTGVFLESVNRSVT